jgi:myo-inositol-1(or 4)-monophosphatase
MTKNLQFIINLTKKAGKIALENINKQIKVKKKGIGDASTDIDIKIENFLITNIKKKFPNHNIICEEEKNINNQSDYTWTIDPIDGTKYFLKGIKFFSTSIALWHNDKPIIGVVYNPGANDCYWAEEKRGSLLNGRKLTVSTTSKLSRALINIDFQEKKCDEEEKKLLEKRLINIHRNFYRVRAYGCGSLALCFLAQGYLDVYFDITGNQPIVDSGGGMIVAKEAGAKITNLEGKYPGVNTSHLVVTNGRIHNQVLNLLK